MKSKQLRKWALVAEIVSAVAVVITIAFLAFQMRDNTNALQAQTYQELMRDINNWRSAIRDSGYLSESQLSEIVAEGISDEMGALRITWLELWGIYEAAFFARERGVLGENEWIRFEFMICFSRRGQASQIFWESEYGGLPGYSETLTPAFVDYVARQCD